MQTTETKTTPKAAMPDNAPLGQVLIKLSRLSAKGGQDVLYDREEPVQVFSEGAGLGKNYAGFRITFRIREGGEKKFSKFTTREKGEIFPNREEPSSAELERFKADISREAAADPHISALIALHPELRLQAE